MVFSTQNVFKPYNSATGCCGCYKHTWLQTLIGQIHRRKNPLGALKTNITSGSGNLWATNYWRPGEAFPQYTLYSSPLQASVFGSWERQDTGREGSLMCPSTTILTLLRKAQESANINIMHVGTISRAKDQIFKGLTVVQWLTAAVTVW